MLTGDKVTELFCMTDDSCKFFDETMVKYTLKSEKRDVPITVIPRCRRLNNSYQKIVPASSAAPRSACAAKFIEFTLF